MIFSSSYGVAPPDQRCVWMTAGVLTYQLCDRRFECAGCPLDTSMRNAYDRPTPPAPHTPVALRPALRQGRYYTAEHCWVDILTPSTVRIGVEPSLAVRLEAAEGISLPAPGRKLSEREAAAWYRFEDGMVPIRLPFDATVTSSNRTVRSNAGLVARSPFDDGWLLEAEVVPEVLAGRGVMTARAAERVFEKDEEAFLAALGVAHPHEVDGCGPRMQDGGEPVGDPLAMLGSARFCALIGRIYCKVT